MSAYERTAVQEAATQSSPINLDETTMDCLTEAPPRPADCRSRDLEARVVRQLTRDTALEFDALSVSFESDALCVNGVVRGIDSVPEAEDLSELIRQISDVDRVLNRLVIAR